MLVKRGIDLAVGRLVEHLQRVAHPVDTEEDYARVAAISANDDDVVGAVHRQGAATPSATPASSPSRSRRRTA